MMTPSQRIIDFIKSWERCRLSAYKPTPNDVWTIGWGSTGPDVGPMTIWTQEHADQRFAQDLDTRTTRLNILFGASPTTQSQFDACCSLAYNIGLANFADSTLLRLHNAGDYEGAANEFQRWDHQGGQVLAGLLKRRLAEAVIYREAA